MPEIKKLILRSYLTSMKDFGPNSGDEFLGAAPSAVVWQRYVQALLLANEFVFVD